MPRSGQEGKTQFFGNVRPFHLVGIQLAGHHTVYRRDSLRDIYNGKLVIESANQHGFISGPIPPGPKEILMTKDQKNMETIASNLAKEMLAAAGQERWRTDLLSIMEKAGL